AGVLADRFGAPAATISTASLSVLWAIVWGAWTWRLWRWQRGLEFAPLHAHDPRHRGLRNEQQKVHRSRELDVRVGEDDRENSERAGAEIVVDLFACIELLDQVQLQLVTPAVRVPVERC